jgi:hypothetical protein
LPGRSKMAPEVVEPLLHVQHVALELTQHAGKTS